MIGSKRGGKVSESRRRQSPRAGRRDELIGSISTGIDEVAIDVEQPGKAVHKMQQ